MPSAKPPLPPSPYAEPPGRPLQALPATLRRRLAGVRTRDLAVAWTEGAAILLGAFVTLAALQMLGDWWFDLPRAVRAILLIADLGVLGWLVHRRLLGPWRRRLTTATAALRAEKTFPKLRGCLIAAVQLSRGSTGGAPVSPSLLAAVIAEASKKTTRHDFRKIVPAGRAMRLAVGSGLLLAAVVCIGILDMDRTAALLRRLALSAEPLPTHTLVIPVTQDVLAALGSGVEIVARASGELPRTGRVRVIYHDGKQEDIAVAADFAEPDLFKLTLPDVRLALTYRFYLGDGRGPTFDVTPLPPPALASLEVEEVFPDYTGRGTLPRTPANLSLLAGSRLRLHIQSTLPLKSATIQPQGAGDPIVMDLASDIRRASGELEIPAENLTGFSIALVSTAGAPSSADTVYRIQIIQDQAPVIQLSQPVAERATITLRATPAVTFEAADDFALTTLAFCYQIAPPTIGDAPAEIGKIVRRTFPIEGSSSRQRRNDPWDLAAIAGNIAEGSVITYWIEAADNNTATGPGLTETRRQQFVIVSPATKRAEILRRLGENSKALKDLSNTQRTLGEEIDHLLASPAP